VILRRKLKIINTVVFWDVSSIIRAIALMMVAASTSETSVNFYQTTRRSNPEDSHIHTRRRENLKYYLKLTM
jgi:hypothetical protein